MKTTKGRILEIGAEIVHRKGFNHTGIQEILSTANVPKGSFYNYFKSKEDFGLELIDTFMGHFARLSSKFLEDTSVPPLQRIENLFKWFMDFFKSKNYSAGCPIGNLSQEMGDLSPAFREKLEDAVDTMAEPFTIVLGEARDRGEISQDLDPGEAAYFLVSSWHGALVRMKIVKGPEPLENHFKFMFGSVLLP
jgi:TetR/AcrR family transcriptional repressor of nem operon